MQYESWLFFFFQVNSTEATHAAKPHVQMVKPFEPWFVGDDAKPAVCSWQPVKITTSEENLINTLLNIMEGKICNSRRNSGHTRLQRRKKKKSLSNSLFPFCCVRWGGGEAGQGAGCCGHPPCTHISPGIRQGALLAPTQLGAFPSQPCQHGDDVHDRARSIITSPPPQILPLCSLPSTSKPRLVRWGPSPLLAFMGFIASPSPG